MNVDSTSPPDLAAFWTLELHELVRRLLKRLTSEAQAEPLRILVQFATRCPGVELPELAVDGEHDEMTIALQQDAGDLVIDAEGFAVTLAFGSDPARFRVPFAAITRFADPANGVGLLLAGRARRIPITSSPAPAEPAVEPAGKVVRLEDFRRP